MMKKHPVFALLACACSALLVYAAYRGELARCYALRMLCWNIAKDLLTNTNSDRVAVINHWSSTNFSAFLGVPGNIEAVKLGDKPKDFIKDSLERQAHATARLYFTNQSNKHFEIRIRQIRSPKDYDVIGASWD